MCMLIIYTYSNRNILSHYQIILKQKTLLKESQSVSDKFPI